MTQPTAPVVVTTANASRPDAFVGFVTEYALRATPTQIECQLRRAYGDRVPGSARRWRDRQREAEWFALGRCETCRRPLPSGRLRWCSKDCRYPAPTIPDPAAITAEMHAALDRLREVVG